MMIIRPTPTTAEIMIESERTNPKSRVSNHSKNSNSSRSLVAVVISSAMIKTNEIIACTMILMTMTTSPNPAVDQVPHVCLLGSILSTSEVNIDSLTMIFKAIIYEYLG